MSSQALVNAYLVRLERAAAGLAPARRAELVGDVAEHIKRALEDAGTRDESAVHNILDRLGAPEEIVAAEVGSAASAISSDPEARANPTIEAVHVRRSPWGAVEIIAILLLGVGAVLLPVIGPLVGLVFVGASGEWTRAQKGVATALVLAELVTVFLLLVPTQAGM